MGYGATFALASLSCTVAPFLAVTAGAVRSGGVAVVATYVAYAVGMGAVVGALSVAAATASSGVTARLRRSAPVIARVSGVSANLCIESHLRELLEQGFDVAVVSDATAAAQHPEMGDGYPAALTKFRYIAGAVLTTEETVQALAV